MSNFWRGMGRKLRDKAARAVLAAVAVIFLLPLTAHAQKTQNLGYSICNVLSDPIFCTVAVQSSATVSNTGSDLVINSGTVTQTTNLTLATNVETIQDIQNFGNLTNITLDTYYVPESLSVGSAGTYDLQAGTLSAPFEVVSGTMNQTGGANQLIDSQAIHVHCFNNSCSTVETVDTIGFLDVVGGTYNLSAGTAQMPILVADGGGTFNQTGGNVTVLPNNSSDLNQPNGALDAGLYIGQNGAGTYNLQSGTLQVGGTYTFSCGSQSGTCNGFANGNEYIGYNSTGNGVFNQSGGSNVIGPPSGGASTLGGNLYVGYQGTGVYNMSGGLLAPFFTTDEFIGNLPGSNGTFNQTGGVNGANIATGGNPTYSVQELFVGYMGNGSYTLGSIGGSATSATLSAGFEEIGSFGFNSTTNKLIAGTGNFVQNSGTNNVTELNVGDQGNTVGGNFTLLNAQGTYTLNGGILNASQGAETIGDESGGVFFQNGGTNITPSLVVGMGNTTNVGDGFYGMSGGTLEICCSAAQIGFGSGAVGIFSQTGGLNEATEIIVGAGGTGTYSLSGANSILDPSVLTIGDSLGSGVFNQTGGTVDLLATFQYNGATEGGGGSLEVGAGATGTYNLGCTSCTGGGGTLIAGNEEIGETINTSFVGTFNQYAGTTNTVTRDALGTGIGNLDVGESGQGVYNQFGGTLTANTENIGAFASTGTFNQSGGTNNVVLGTPGTGVLNVGANGTGTYNLSGPSTGVGATMLNAVNENIGAGVCVGTFNQSGGVNNVSGTLIVGAGNGSNAQGYYFQTGGLLNAANEIIGNNSTAQSPLTQAFSQTGGTNTVTGTLTIGSSQFSQSAPGVYVLDGGTLNASTITIGTAGIFAINPNGAPSGAASLNLLAGTIMNNGTIDIISGPSTVITASGANYIGNGGLILDPATLNFANFNFGTNGYLKGALGDLLNVSGNFLNNSTQGALWNSSSVTLDFSSGLHDVFFSTGSSATMFNWGDLVLGVGANLTFGTGSGGLFANAVTLGAGSGFCGGDIFYDVNDAANSSLKGATDTFSCGGGLAAGELIPFDGAVIGQGSTSPTPEPAAWVLLLSGLSLFVFLKWTGKLDFQFGAVRSGAQRRSR